MSNYRAALDGLAKLTAYWRERRHDDALHRYDILCAEYMSGYAENHMDWADFTRAHPPLTEADGRMKAAQNRQLLADAMEQTVPFYVAPHIGDLLTAAAAGMPTVTLTDDLLPAEAGVLWFDQPPPLYRVMNDAEIFRYTFTYDDMYTTPEVRRAHPEEPGAWPICIRPSLLAVAWHPLYHSDDGRRILRKLVVAFYYCYDTSDYARLDPRGPLPARADFNFEFGYAVDFGGALAEPVATPLRNGHNNGIALACDIFTSALLFMRQTILEAPPRALTKRPALRALTRQLRRPPPDVRVLQLRARLAPDAPASVGTAGTKQVEWQCRWLVRGHWRRQYYPKTGEHRPVFIFPYTKGPADKPLVVKTLVGALVR